MLQAVILTTDLSTTTRNHVKVGFVPADDEQAISGIRVVPHVPVDRWNHNAAVPYRATGHRVRQFCVGHWKQI
jgi:hypothetical protein